MRFAAFPKLKLGCGVLVVFSLLLSCDAPQSETVTYAYVAPASINLRRDLTQKNGSVAVLNHGDKVQVLEVRRRFVHVRTKDRADGWVDASQLLTPEQMAAIQGKANDASKLPSEGAATVFEALNVHLEPSRQSPSFARIPEGVSVEVLAIKATPRLSGPAKPPVFKVDRAQPLRRKKKDTKDAIHLPPKPAAPPAPANWMELSGINPNDSHSRQQPPAPPAQPEKPPVLETWSLVRMKDKRVGWVLSRNLLMSVPDEVAQYAEGKRITSYFDLGTVVDEEKGVKHHWLWTTQSEVASYDFDAWRVFTWNHRRHRYETSFRQREVEGYFPVHVEEADTASPLRKFDLITRDEDGKYRRRSYSFDGTLVHLAGTEDYNPAADSARTVSAIAPHSSSPKAGWFSSVWMKLRTRLHLGS